METKHVVAVNSGQPFADNVLSPVLHRAQFPIFLPGLVAHMEEPHTDALLASAWYFKPAIGVLEDQQQ